MSKFSSFEPGLSLGGRSETWFLQTSTRRLRYGACWNSPPWAPSPRCRHGAHCPAGGASLTRSGNLSEAAGRRGPVGTLPPRPLASAASGWRRRRARVPAGSSAAVGSRHHRQRPPGGPARACAGHWQSLHAGPWGGKLPPRPRASARKCPEPRSSHAKGHPKMKVSWPPGRQ